MKRIMFVCHGNICRSPMAEYIMKHLLTVLNLENGYTVASSATSTEELGSPVYPPAQRELYRHGISCGRREATQLSSEDYGRYDLFVLMDDRNMRNILRIFKSDPEGKICQLTSVLGSSRDVSDPWYSGDFSRAYDDIFEGCVALISALEPRFTREYILRAFSSAGKQ